MRKIIIFVLLWVPIIWTTAEEALGILYKNTPLYESIESLKVIAELSKDTKVKIDATKRAMVNQEQELGYLLVETDSKKGWIEENSCNQVLFQKQDMIVGKRCDTITTGKTVINPMRNFPVCTLFVSNSNTYFEKKLYGYNERSIGYFRMDSAEIGNVNNDNISDIFIIGEALGLLFDGPSFNTKVKEVYNVDINGLINIFTFHYEGGSDDSFQRYFTDIIDGNRDGFLESIYEYTYDLVPEEYLYHYLLSRSHFIWDGSKYTVTETHECKNVFINADGVRLRQGPSIDTEILGKLNTNNKVKIMNRTLNQVKIDKMNNYWYEIYSRDLKSSGWVYGEYLTFEWKLVKE